MEHKPTEYELSLRTRLQDLRNRLSALKRQPDSQQKRSQVAGIRQQIKSTHDKLEQLMRDSMPELVNPF